MTGLNALPFYNGLLHAFPYQLTGLSTRFGARVLVRPPRGCAGGVRDLGYVGVLGGFGPGCGGLPVAVLFLILALPMVRFALLVLMLSLFTGVYSHFVAPT